MWFVILKQTQDTFHVLAELQFLEIEKSTVDLIATYVSIATFAVIEDTYRPCQ